MAILVTLKAGRLESRASVAGDGQAAAFLVQADVELSAMGYGEPPNREQVVLGVGPPRQHPHIAGAGPASISCSCWGANLFGSMLKPPKAVAKCVDCPWMRIRK